VLSHFQEQIYATNEHEVKNHLIFLAHRYAVFFEGCKLCFLTARRGINCRHLGYVRRFISEEKPGPQVKEIILTELVARVMKNQVTFV
jgi:hypothetical protein